MRVDIRHCLLCLLACVLTALFVSCTGQQVDAPENLPAYRFVRGQTAALHNGRAIPPPNVPPQVKRAIYAANSIAGKPYRMGGGHRKHHDSSYDCSGTVSYVLREAGLMTSIRHSKLFLNYGSKGPGRWISIYAKNGHVFMVICGIRFDTSGRGGKGPAWRTDSRSTRNFVVRHPTGL